MSDDSIYDYIYIVQRDCTKEDPNDDLWAFTNLRDLLAAVANSKYDPDTLDVTRVVDGILNLDKDEEFIIDLGYELRKAGYVKED